MKTIWKLGLRVNREAQLFDIPEDARPLSLQVQNHIPTLWMMVETDNPCERRVVRMVGTGWPMDADFAAAEYLGTAQVGSTVWHYFMDPKP